MSSSAFIPSAAVAAATPMLAPRLSSMPPTAVGAASASRMR